jgi:RNA polymerase-associated protein RTF1
LLLSPYSVTDTSLAITTGKPYLLEGRVTTFYTDMQVKLASGKSTKEWPFTHCSESSFTESEFERWKKQMEVDGLSLPSKSECRKICESINALIEHRFTGDELNVKLAKQKKYQDMLQPAKPSLVKQNNGMDQQQKLRLLNELNRKQNAEDVRNALVAEKNRQRAAARVRHIEATKKKVADEAAAATYKQGLLSAPANDIDGLFSEGSDISRAPTPVQAPKSPKPQEKKGGIPTFSKMCMDDEIIGNIDLGIDIDI